MTVQNNCSAFIVLQVHVRECKHVAADNNKHTFLNKQRFALIESNQMAWIQRTIGVISIVAAESLLVNSNFPHANRMQGWYWIRHLSNPSNFNSYPLPDTSPCPRSQWAGGGLGPLWRKRKTPFDVIYYPYKIKQSHWLLCVAKNCDWSRKIPPLSNRLLNLTRESLLMECKLTESRIELRTIQIS